MNRISQIGFVFEIIFYAFNSGSLSNNRSSLALVKWGDMVRIFLNLFKVNKIKDTFQHNELSAGFFSRTVQFAFKKNFLVNCFL